MSHAKIVDVRVEGDLYVSGRDDEGNEVIAENFMVVVEFANGEIYRHEQVWPGCRVEDITEEGYGGKVFYDIRPQAEVEANGLCARVQAYVGKGGNLNMTHWAFRRTSYGSSAYLDECSMMTPRQLAGEDD